MAYTLDLNIAESYEIGRHVLRTTDGLTWDLIRENAAGGNYGTFYDHTTQTQTLPNTAKLLEISTAGTRNGVRLESNSIYYDFSGVYSVNYCLHFTNTTVSPQEVAVWATKNTDANALTTNVITVPALSNVVFHKTFLDVVEEDDYHRIMWVASDIGVTVRSVPAVSPVPLAPAVLISVMEIANPTG